MIFSFQFRKIVIRYKRTVYILGYNLNVMRQSACLVFSPITVDDYASFFNCTRVGRSSDSFKNRLSMLQSHRFKLRLATTFTTLNALKKRKIYISISKTHNSNLLKLRHTIILPPCLYWTKFCRSQDTTENSRAPPMRHRSFKMARRVCDTYEMCNCFILSY